MCTLIVAHRPNASFPLVIAANRDERYDRPSAPMQFWDDAPDLLAGRDLELGGTWLGVTRDGRWAAVTNYFDPLGSDRPLSRGALVTDYLLGDRSPRAYLEATREQADRYRAFNVLVGDGAELQYLSNRDGPVRDVAPGVHAVSNHLLDTPWPKVERAVAGMTDACDTFTGPDDAPALIATLHEMLTDTTEAADDDLPQVQMPLALRRKVSALFVRTPVYGTCCSTVVVVGADGRVHAEERVFNPSVIGGGPPQVASHSFAIERDADVTSDP